MPACRLSRERDNLTQGPILEHPDAPGPRGGIFPNQAGPSIAQEVSDPNNVPARTHGAQAECPSGHAPVGQEDASLASYAIFPHQIRRTIAIKVFSDGWLGDARKQLTKIVHVRRAESSAQIKLNAGIVSS